MNQLIGYLSEGEQLKGSLTIPKQLGGSTLGSKTITANGVYDATDDGLDGYDVVTANVPNTYAVGDEGKVVDNGALVSQTTATYTVNNTYDTTKIKSVTVNVGGGSPTLETITKTYTPTASQQTDTITPGVGYDGIAEVDVTVNAMPTGTEGTPTATKGSVSNHAVQVTPSVTNQAGYIAGGTKTGTVVTVSASELVSGTKQITQNGTGIDVTNYASADVAVPNSYSAADEGKVVSSGALVAQTAHADVTPTTSDQTIDTTLNNSLKVKGDADLVAGNIKKDVEIFGVTGSYEGGGGGSSWQSATGTFTPSQIYSSETVKITDDTTIGFTPTIFILAMDDKSQAMYQYALVQSYYYKVGTANNSYRGSMRYTNTTGSLQSNAVSGDPWTSDAASLLNYSSGDIRIHTSAGYNLRDVDYVWYAFAPAT